jgi:hypothetical protein
MLLQRQDDEAVYEVLSLAYVPGSTSSFYATLSGRWSGHVWQASFQDSLEVCTSGLCECYLSL